MSTNTDSDTTGQFIAALLVGLITVAVFTTLWVFLHKRYRRVFQPRLELAVPDKRPEELPGGVLSWWKAILDTPDRAIIPANGLDAYFFVRYLKIFGLYTLVPYVLLTCVILIPVSAAANGHLKGLNRFTFGNVTSNELNRHIAHYLVATILIFWTLYILYNEFIHLDEQRQAWLASETHLSLARTRTVMVINLPSRYMTKSGFLELVTAVTGNSGGNNNGAGGPTSNTTPSSVQTIWFAYTNMKKIEKVYDERNQECARLEDGEASLLSLAAKKERKGKSPRAKGNVVPYEPDTEAGEQRFPSDDVVDEYVRPKKRPTWKLGFLGLIGEKHNLGNSPKYIAEKNRELEELRAKIVESGRVDVAAGGDEQEEQEEKEKKDDDGEEVKIGNTAWARFSTQHEAHLFARLVRHIKGGDLSMKLIDSRIEVVPEDIVWNNTSMNAYDRKIRNIISWSLTIGLIIVWAIPVAFVGIISNVDTLCHTVKFLSWLCKIPGAVLGILKGVLPPVLLTVLFIVLIMILRTLINLQGIARQSESGLKLFQRFWLFQIIHGFLIVTVASGLVGTLSNIKHTIHQLPTLLATNLPTASIFFLTFVLASTWSGAASSYSRAIPTVMYLLRGFLGGNTPRKYWASETKMISFDLSLVWPPICLLLCICIVYSVIQPIMTVIGLVAFAMLYVAYKYLMYWCADQPDAMETGGLFYFLALRTVFVALYIEEWFLTALLFLSYSQQTKIGKSDLAGGIVMAITVAATIAVQYWLLHIRFPEDYLVYSRTSYLEGRSPSTTNLSPKQDEIVSAEPLSNPTAAQDDFAGGNISGWDARAFDHPALWKKQPTVWIANDELGIGRLEVERIQSFGVDASCEYASLDKQGKLAVERNAPDEPWFGGADV